MSARIEVVQLLPYNKAINASSQDISFNSTTVDLRVGVARINAVVARGFSPSSLGLDYRIFWYGGITTSEIVGTLTGMTGGDRFEEPTVNTQVIDTYPGATLPAGGAAEGYQAWIFAPMPAVLAPFVRFQLLVKGGSAADALFNLYAVVQRHFDT